MKPHQIVRLAPALFAASLFIAPLAQADEGEAIYESSGCAACHTVDQKRMGPMYKDVAAKYKGNPDAPAMLAKKIREGGAGVWGTVPMPPHPADRLSDDEIKLVVKWILSR
ncbi:c-type cytochrome [Cognatazoarcus halotolerans]|uniref:c-type cytochrome n=1 Tax=Cognatazoarcus halotolerans TaxID=2686016 RepID=UPI001359C9BA|nr:c-type cytochrome [Cognatazoarcus halotolerans]